MNLDAKMTEQGKGQIRKGKNEKVKKCAGKFDFETLYEQIKGDNSVLEANKSFWVRKGNSKKYLCTLCNIGVQISSNLTIFKAAILAHVEDKYHRKRYELYTAKKSTVSCNLEKDAIDPCSEVANEEKIENDKCILDLMEEMEGNLSIAIPQSDSDLKKISSNNCLVDFDTIYSSFEKSSPVMKTSKQYIVKTENGRNYFCKLCKVLIYNSLNANEFRYNLWMHLNEEGHRKKLPNFAEVEIDFNNLISTLSNALPSSLKQELKYLEIGPVFRFLRCSVCDVAVSTNVHRIENHLQGKEHKKGENRMQVLGISLTEPLSNRTRNAFRQLVVRLDDRFKNDIKHIHIGKIPGYVVCSLCTYVIVPTKFYVESHLLSPVHIKNKTTNLVCSKSKFKISLKDLMKTLPEDLKDYNIFEESNCGLTCKRCNTTIPPTSYDIYTHINKERLRHVSV